MKKIAKISLALLIAVCMMTKVYAALSATVTLSAEKEAVSKNDKVVIDVNLSNIQGEKGVIALGAILEYDSEKLEFDKMEGKNGWATPSYNEENGKFTTERNGFATGNETMFTITFNVKDTAKGEARVELKEISVSDGEDEPTLKNAVKVITISSGDSGNQGGNNNSGGDNGNQGGNNNPGGDNGTQGGNNNPGGDNGNQGGNNNPSGDNGNQGGNNNPSGDNGNQGGSNNPNNNGQIGNNPDGGNSNTNTNTGNKVELPKAGQNNTAFYVAAGLAVAAVGLFIKIKIIDGKF